MIYNTRNQSNDTTESQKEKKVNIEKWSTLRWKIKSLQNQWEIALQDWAMIEFYELVILFGKIIA